MTSKTTTTVWVSLEEPGIDKRFLPTTITTVRVMSCGYEVIPIRSHWNDDDRATYIVDWVNEFERDFKIGVDMVCWVGELRDPATAHLWQHCGECSAHIEGIVKHHTFERLLGEFKRHMQETVRDLSHGCGKLRSSSPDTLYLCKSGRHRSVSMNRIKTHIFEATGMRVLPAIPFSKSCNAPPTGRGHAFAIGA